MKNNVYLKFLIVIIITLLIIFNFSLKKNNISDESQLFTETNKKVSIFNLNSPLEPKEIYEPILCRNSNFKKIITSLCIHDVKSDIYVSGSIWRNGIWEEQILAKYIRYLKLNKEWMVLDLGAQIGQYSIFAAQMGRPVLAVEPFYDNILRIHKAATLQKLQDKITLVTNAISDKRNEVKLLKSVEENIGGQGLVNFHDKVFSKNASNKYLVETILFDDLVEYLPKNIENNKTYEHALLKIDIEGFEPFAFQHASKLFNAIKIPVIFMEWGNINNNFNKFRNITEDMIEFFKSRKYNPYNLNNQLLDFNKPNSWPWDIIWIL